jgi:hypothetical protein
MKHDFKYLKFGCGARPDILRSGVRVRPNAIGFVTESNPIALGLAGWVCLWSQTELSWVWLIGSIITSK